MTQLPRNYAAQVQAPRPDILSPWRQLLTLPLPCHKHWQRSCCQRPARTAAICRKPGFRGRSRVHARECVLGPCLHAGCARAACVDSGSRGNDMGAGGLCLSPRVGGVRWRGPTCSRSIMRGRCASGCVEDWATRCVPSVLG
jgi:hypothetical protein